MVKLTVIYNLPPGADHEAFLRWRTTEHQAENMSTLQSTFFDPEYQKKLAESLKLIAEPLFLISEEMLSEVAR